MSKQYGLIVPGKEKEKIMSRPSIFEDSDSDEQPKKPTGLKKSLKKQDKIAQQKVIEEDPTVYQYDEVYDEMDKKRKESKLSRKDLNRTPKYINKLLAAADRRKKENERRIERQIQKERETEGDEFKDKEAFVTSGYKKKLEEMKELEKQEQREEYLERIGDVTKQENLDGFYRHLYDQKVNYRSDDNQESQVKNKGTVSFNTEEANKLSSRKYRVHQDSDSDKTEEESVEIKKEHLPSNLDADSDFSIDSSDSEDEKEKTDANNDNLVTAIVPKEETEKHEENQVTTTVSAADVDVEPAKPKRLKIDIWKKRTTGAVFDAALQRYYERKALIS